MFEGEGKAIVYGCKLDDGILHNYPVCVLVRGNRGNRQKEILVIILKKCIRILAVYIVGQRILTLFPPESMGQSYFSSQLSFPLSTKPNTYSISQK